MAKRNKNPNRPSKMGRGRSNESFGRSQGDDIPNDLILILCGGAETEFRYFNAIRTALELRNAQVRIVPTGNLFQQSIVQETRKHEKTFDEIWCVFDRETPAETGSFASAVQEADGKAKVHLAISTPCFEYWYLLHYEPTDRLLISYKDVEAVLKRHLPLYAKDKLPIDIHNVELRQKAIAYAKKQFPYSRHLPLIERFPYPSTHVYLLVERLESLRD